MSLTTPLFLYILLPVTLALAAITRGAWRNGVLLLASLAFYTAGDVAALPVLLLNIVVNYGLALALANRQGNARQRLLAMGVALNLAGLVYAKYTRFLLESLGLPSLGTMAPHLPLGISFFTFQAIAYLVDVARGTVAAEGNLLRYGLAMAFFPKITAGPIVRQAQMQPDLLQPVMTWQGFGQGAGRFIQGLAKKSLIAGQMGPLADAAFGATASGLDAATAWLGLVAYTLQIYFDFSGYTDMAVGLGRMFGFRLPENFNYPYAARSVQEFWRRWHMTLSAWFRDYLYIPLGGNRVPSWRIYANLLMVFGLCGLWHGASWSFLIWGLWHGLFLILERLGLARLLERAPVVLRHGYLLLAIALGWVFFRAESLGQAGTYLRALFQFDAGGFAYTWMTHVSRATVLALVVGLCLSGPVVPWLRPRLEGWLQGLSGAGAVAARSVAALALPALLAVCLMYLAGGSYTPFIYARF